MWINPNKDRVVLHCDMNNCYASIEIKLNPALRGKPIAVGGSIEDRHGIVLAKSEEAKKCGVKTAEVIWQAKQKCPDLIVVPPHFDEYHKYSEAARVIYADYTDMIEPFGLDECWLDVTASQKLFGSGEQIAHLIRERVKKELGITVSVGVSFNKVLAKLGSDLKKPDAVTVIPYEGFDKILEPLPVENLLGVGKSTLMKLHTAEIYTIGDLARYSIDELHGKFGKQGDMLWAYANGLECSPVMHQTYKAPPKSIGRGVTCPKDLTKREDIWKVIYRLSDTVANELRKADKRAYGIQITVRSTLLVDKQAQKTFSIPLHAAKDIAQNAFALVESIYHYDYPIRALTVRAISLVASNAGQQMMGDEGLKLDKLERREQAIFELRDKYGKSILAPATLTKAPGEQPEKESEFAKQPGFKQTVLHGWQG